MPSFFEARSQGIRDARLVEGVRAGERRAFELLYERHHAPILSFCRHLTGRLEDAEDAVQHTFLSAYREINGSAEELDLKPWLYTVARNRCLSLLRSRRIREGPAGGALWTGRHGPPEEGAVETTGLHGLDEEVERREELRALVADLGQLPEPQRAALVLSELEALSHAQVAQVLHVEPAKVRSLVFQARSSLISTRDARNTPCGEIRFQLSTLGGSSLRRRTLRRHVRACSGCSEFEAAVRGQRRDLALILPIAGGTGLRDAVLGSLLGGGGAAGSGAGAAGGLAAGGAALAGGAAGGAAGVFGGLAAVVAGSGVAQATAVVAIVATGTVGVAKARVVERLGLVEGWQLVDRRADAPSRDAPPGSGPAAVDPLRAGAGDRGSDSGGGSGGSDPRGGTRDDAKDDPQGRAKETAPGQLKKKSPEGAVPPGLAKKGNGDTPPGLAKKGEDWTPPGQAGRDERGTPPGQAKQEGGGNGRQPAKTGPPGQADRPSGGGPVDRGNPAPPGQEKKAPAPAEQPTGSQPKQPTGSPPEHPGGGQPDKPAKQTPPGQAKDPKAG